MKMQLKEFLGHVVGAMWDQMARTGRGYKYAKRVRDGRRPDKLLYSKALRRVRAHP
jgi:hypothetical protein